MAPLIRSRPDGAEIEVLALPGARADAVVGEHGGRLKVRVSAPAESGRANRALCALLARTLGVREARVAVVAGTTSRHKRVKVEGLSADEVAMRLHPDPSG